MVSVNVFMPFDGRSYNQNTHYRYGLMGVHFVLFSRFFFVCCCLSWYQNCTAVKFQINEDNHTVKKKQQALHEIWARFLGKRRESTTATEKGGGGEGHNKPHIRHTIINATHRNISQIQQII